MKDFAIFEKKINIKFKNKELLKRAFTHRSYINEYREEGLKHNERLEFLGDAVLELIVTEYLFEKYPDRHEGELTAFRAALVNTNTLSKTASSIDMNDFLLLSKGEAKDVGKARQYILANAFEAVIGAIYMDQGYESAKNFIANTIFPLTDEIVSKKLWQDSKSYFQEKAQEHTGVTPSYSVLAEEGPDHDRHFTVGVFLEDKMIGKGEGKSKQEAEQNAAEESLQSKGWK